MDRRSFIRYTAAAGSALMIEPFTPFAQAGNKKIKVALVGTGIRGTGLWGDDLIKNFGEAVEFVALCDTNPGRVAYAKKFMKVSCPTFTDYEKLLKETKPDYVIVTTVDAEHHHQIIRALESGIDVITEKPMTTDE